MKNLSTKSLGILLGLTAFSILAFGDVTIKATTAYYDTFATGLYLNLFTIAFLIPVIIYKGGIKKAFQSSTPKLHILRSCFMLGVFTCIIFTFSHLPLANSYTMGFLMPFVLNILAIFVLKEKISFLRWGTIILAFIGVVIAMRPGIEPFNIGYISMALVVLFLACAVLTIKFIDHTDDWLPYICYPMAIQTPVLALLVFLQGQPLFPPFEPEPYFWMIIGGFAFSIGLSLLPQGIKRVDASIAGSLLYVTFPWGVLYGYFIFGDTVDLWTLLGAVIIIASGIFLIYREKVEDSKLLKLDE